MHGVRALRPLSPSVWASAFAGDPDLDFLLYLVDAGVHVLPVDRLPGAFVVPNHSSFVEKLSLAAPILREELDHAILVPAPAGCVSRFVHPMGTVPKGAGVRIIQDLSSPFGASINAEQRHWHRSWMSADSIMAMLQPGDYIAKTDISAYYRQLPVHPLHWPLLALQFEDMHVWDTRLPFGLRTAPEIADRVTAALVRRAAGVGCIARLAAVVDDFTVFHQDAGTCARDWRWLMGDMTSLGFPVHPSKSEGPAQEQKVLGIVWNSVAMTASLDATKLAQLKEKLAKFVGAKKCTKRELQSVLGHLYYASRVVFAGRVFTFHLAQLLRQSHARLPHHRIYLNAAAKSDLRWWLAHVDMCNGQQALLPAKPVCWRSFQTDASLTGGPGGQPCIGIWLEGAYVSLSRVQLLAMFSDVPCLGADINIWEFYCVVVACRLFGDYMSGQHWRVRTDNSSCEAWIMRGVRSSPLVAGWLRELMSLSLHLGFRLTAKHIAGALNVVADALSRCEWATFHTYLLHHKCTFSAS